LVGLTSKLTCNIVLHTAPDQHTISLTLIKVAPHRAALDPLRTELLTIRYICFDVVVIHSVGAVPHCGASTQCSFINHQQLMVS